MSEKTRQTISEILIKHDMPTRQVAIGELVAMVEEIEKETTRLAVITTLKGLLDPDYEDEFLYGTIKNQLELYTDFLTTQTPERSDGDVQSK